MTALQNLEQLLSDMGTRATTLADEWKATLAEQQPADEQFNHDLAALHARKDVCSSSRINKRQF